MSHVFARPTLWRRLRPILLGFDLPLLVVVFALAGLGMVTMYSVGYDHGTRFQDHGRNMVLAALLMFAVAQIPPQRLMALAVPLYVLAVALQIGRAHV